MIEIRLQYQTYQKRYLQDLQQNHFDSFLELVFKLFEHYENPQRFEEWEQWIGELLRALMENLGYSSILEIPREEIAVVANYYYNSKERAELEYDSEKVAYLLLAAIQKGQVFAFVDDALIEDFQKPIQLHQNSFISFLDKEKMKAIQFKTI